jgi:hypothetical protein
VTCIGFALGIAYMTCTLPHAAPTGKAPFCQVVRQAGGALKPSRKDTPESTRYMNRIAAAYRADCSK